MWRKDGKHEVPFLRRRQWLLNLAPFPSQLSSPSSRLNLCNFWRECCRLPSTAIYSIRFVSWFHPNGEDSKNLFLYHKSLALTIKVLALLWVSRLYFRNKKSRFDSSIFWNLSFPKAISPVLKQNLGFYVTVPRRSLKFTVMRWFPLQRITLLHLVMSQFALPILAMIRFSGEPRKGRWRLLGVPRRQKRKLKKERNISKNRKRLDI